MTGRDEALAELAEGVGKALLRYADRLRGNDAMSSVAVAAPATRDTDREAGLGGSQLKVLAAVREAGEGGVTSHSVAKSTGLRSSNTPDILRKLKRRGLVEEVGENPITWVAIP